MSDVTGATQVAPPAPPAAPALPTTPAPAATPAAPEQEQQLTPGTGRHAARVRAQERGKRIAERAEREAADRQRADAARDRALGQPRSEAGTTGAEGKPVGGQFTETPKGEGDAAALPGPAAADASAEPKAGAGTPAPAQATSTTEATQVPAGMVDIPLPEGHPLRDRGVTKIRVAKEDEQYARNGVNAAVRLKTVETERDDLARQHALLEARNQALTGDLTKYQTDPVFAELIEQVRKAPGFGDQMADLILAGMKAREELAVGKAEGQASREFDMQRTAYQIESDILTQAHQVLGVWAGAGEIMTRVPALVKDYFVACDQREQQTGRVIPPTPEEFFKWVAPAYRSDPRVQQAIGQLRATEAKQREDAIRAEERRKLQAEQDAERAEAAKRRAGLPPTSRSLPAGTTGAPVTTPPAPQPQRAAHGQHRQQARQRAAEIGKRYGQPQP